MLDEYQLLKTLISTFHKSLESHPKESERSQEATKYGMKIFFHSSSLYHLCSGTPYIGVDKPEYFLDFQSIIVIFRAIAETYATFHNIVTKPKSLDEFKYWVIRSQLNKLGMFSKRESHEPKHLNDEDMEKKRLNSKKFEDLKKELQANEYFKKLDKKEQTNAFKGEKSSSITDLIQDSPVFSDQNAPILYALLSAPSHADAWSLSLFDPVSEKKNEKEYISLCVKFTNGILVDFIQKLNGLE